MMIKLEDLKAYTRTDLLFVSCAGSWRDVQPFLHFSRLHSAYHVCGRHPWLFIVTPLEASSNTAQAADMLLALHQFRLGPKSRAFAKLTWPGTDDRLSATETSIHNFVFLRPGDSGSLREAWFPGLRQLQDTLAMQPAMEPGRLFLLDESDWWYLLEVCVPAVDVLTKFLNDLADSSFYSSTKIVLVPWKEMGDTDAYQAVNEKRRATFAMSCLPNANFKIATIIRNERLFFEDRPDIQLSKLIHRLTLPRRFDGPQPSDDHVRKQLWTTFPGNYVTDDPLEHQNQYVERFTLRPTSRMWQLTWLFVKAKKREWRKLSDALRRLVGVTRSRVIPRIYQITGEYDFLLPVYRLGALDDSIAHEIQTLPVEGVPMSLDCKLPISRGSEVSEPLSEESTLSAEALLRNAIDSKSYWDEINNLREAWREYQNGRPDKYERLSAELSPRVLALSRKIPGLWDEFISEWPRHNEDLGMQLTWELKSPPVTAFVRLQPLDSSNELERKIIDLMKRDEITIDYFLRGIARNEIVGIIRISTFEDLEKFLVEVRQVCERTEFHLILKTFASFPNLPPELECRPCVFPKTLGLQRTEKMGCCHCVRYLRSGKSLKVRIDLDRSCSRLPERITIGLLELHLSPTDLVEIGSLPAETRGSKVPLDYSASAPWRSVDGATKLGKDLWECLSKTEVIKADIVVLPEYAVPLHSLNVLLKMLAEWVPPAAPLQLWVLGSHIDEKGYSVAPIVSIKKDGNEVLRQLYLQPKLQPADSEKAFVTYRGNGTCVFKTHFGNVAVMVCRDAFDTDPKNLRDIDFLLVPSYHDGTLDSLPSQLLNHISVVRNAVVFANGAAQIRHPPVFSFIAWHGNTHPANQNGESVKVGGFSGGVMTAQAFPLDLDLNRVKASHGTPPMSVFPLHPDRWPDDYKRRHRTELEERLEAIKPYSVNAEGHLQDYLTMEWHDATMAWRRWTAGRRA